VELLVHEAAGRGHPLHVARADAPAAARAVAVLDLAVIDDGDRLEAAVRVLADAEARGRGRELARAGVVEEQEGADRRALGVVEERSDGEAVADPVRVRVGRDGQKLLVAVAHRSCPLLAVAVRRAAGTLAARRVVRNEPAAGRPLLALVAGGGHTRPLHVRHRGHR
jgi:hypothetical protein